VRLRAVFAISIFGVAAWACAGGGASGTRTATSPASARDAGADATADAGTRLATLDEIAARGASEAPLMHETMRVEGTVGKKPLAETRADKDICVRALFEASKPVRVAIADDTGAKRGDVASAASGAAPPRGPACAKKGETLRVVGEGDDGTTVRVVVFVSP
jgi:hypothetical protein